MVSRSSRGRRGARSSAAERSEQYFCSALGAIGGIVFLASKLPGIGADPKPVDDIGSPQAIGESFLREHLLPFEVTSLVLLVAAVGAVLLAKRAVLAERGR